LGPEDIVVDVPDHADWLTVHSLSDPAMAIEDREWPI
jgi:hypothetical protein